MKNIDRKILAILKKTDSELGTGLSVSEMMEIMPDDVMEYSVRDALVRLVKADLVFKQQCKPEGVINSRMKFFWSGEESRLTGQNQVEQLPESPANCNEPADRPVTVKMGIQSGCDTPSSAHPQIDRQLELVAAKMELPDRHEIADFELKTHVLTKLSAIMERDIRDVLLAIKKDLESVAC